MGVKQIFDTFYVDGPTSGPPQIGEFYWVPCPEIGFKVVEAVRATPQATKVYEIRLAEFDSNKHFKSKEHLPTLLVKDATGEALLYQAKKRICLVVGAGHVGDLHSISDSVQQRQAKELGHPTYLVAPLFSCSCAAKTTQFTPIITARVRALQYPNLAYVPDFEGQEPGSILRLDCMFPTTLGVGMHRLRKKLHDDVRTLVLAQICEVMQLDMPDGWREHLRSTKELVENCLPDGL
jgi:hypothetical protein